ASCPPAVFYVDCARLPSYEAAHFGFQHAVVEYYREEDDAIRRVETLIALLAEPGRAFGWMHILGPHEPYVAHPGIDFGDRPVDRYDAEIRAVDDALRVLLGELAARRPGAIIILTADHGEEFGEHGGAYHGSSLHDEQVRVPLIVRVPGLPPARVAGPVSTIDVAAPIYALVGVAAPPGLRGQDLTRWLGGGTREGPVFAERNDQQMVVLGHDKLICDVARGSCRLFDLDADPGETRDVAGERPDRVATLR